ncbi:MAG: tRNA (N6-isopentenyl adenosine(37)-C2)-methylthiotransferase MiaB [bacterium]
MEKFYIETYGCQMNEADSEYMASVLLSLGFEASSEIGDADIILVNTCSIREKAESKVLSFLGRAYPYKKKRNAVLGVCGCVARKEGENLIKKAPYLDMVFGPHHIGRLPDFINAVKNEKKKVVEVSDRDEIDRNSDLVVPTGLRAMVPIMQGCNNFCSFCIVPFVRGREVSRKIEDVINEIKNLVSKGAKEVMLLGQNVNSYGNDLGQKNAFVGLLEKVNGINGVERIRFTTSHPKDLTDELINAFGTLDKLCPQLHLPLQSGSDKILALMNRKYDSATYLSLIDKVRKVCPEIAITTDIIVGFPGEEEDDFKATIEMVKRVQYDGAFSFKYSARPKTKAASMPSQVPEEIKQRRLEELQALQREITYSKNRLLEGKVLPVLVENVNKRNSKEFSGRTPCFRIVNFTASEEREGLIGKVVFVKIIKGLKNSLKGEMIS